MLSSFIPTRGLKATSTARSPQRHRGTEKGLSPGFASIRVHSRLKPFSATFFFAPSRETKSFSCVSCLSWSPPCRRPFSAPPCLCGENHVTRLQRVRQFRANSRHSCHAFDFAFPTRVHPCPSVVKPPPLPFVGCWMFSWLISRMRMHAASCPRSNGSSLGTMRAQSATAKGQRG